MIATMKSPKVRCLILELINDSTNASPWPHPNKPLMNSPNNSSPIDQICQDKTDYCQPSMGMTEWDRYQPGTYQYDERRKGGFPMTNVGNDRMGRYLQETRRRNGVVASTHPNGKTKDHGYMPWLWPCCTLHLHR